MAVLLDANTSFNSRSTVSHFFYLAASAIMVIYPVYLSGQNAVSGRE